MQGVNFKKLDSFINHDILLNLSKMVGLFVVCDLQRVGVTVLDFCRQMSPSKDTDIRIFVDKFEFFLNQEKNILLTRQVLGEGWGRVSKNEGST